MASAASSSPLKSGTGSAIAAIVAVSVAATLSLFWLIYLHPAPDVANVRFAFLPPLNAVMNGLGAAALLIGFTFIRSRRVAAHRTSMITAFVFSTLFLVGYILHCQRQLKNPQIWSLENSPVWGWLMFGKGPGVCGGGRSPEPHMPERPIPPVVRPLPWWCSWRRSRRPSSCL